MKNRMIHIATWAVLPLGLAAFTSCNSGGGSGQEQVIKIDGGEAVIDTYKIDATVTAVDPAKRKVTIADASGKKTTFKAKDVDISQLQPGDRLQATLTEEVAISLQKAGKAGTTSGPSASEAAVAADAATSGEAAMLVGDSVQLTSKVTATDPKKRKVTLALPDGTSKTVKAGKNIDLSKVSVGDDVTVQVTEALAVDLQEK